MVSARPSGVSTPRGGHPADRDRSRSRSQALRALSCPFRDQIPAAPHHSVATPVRKPGKRLVPRCSLSWDFVPYDTVSDQRIRVSGGRSLHRRVPRARFGYLLRGVHHWSYRRAKRRSVPGLRPSRRSPRRERCPSRGPYPPDVAGDSTPRGEQRRAVAYRVLFPRPSPCCHTGSRGNPAVDAFLGFSPPELSFHPPGLSLVVTMPALSPLGGLTSPPTWTLGLRVSDGSVWSVSGLPALLGFCTFRPSRRSVHGPGERAHGFTSRRTPRVSATPTAI